MGLSISLLLWLLWPLPAQSITLLAPFQPLWWLDPPSPTHTLTKLLTPLHLVTLLATEKPQMELVPLPENTELFCPIPELKLSNIPFLLLLDTLRKCHTQAHPFTAQLHKSNLPFSTISKHPQAPSEQD